MANEKQKAINFFDYMKKMDLGQLQETSKIINSRIKYLKGSNDLLKKFGDMETEEIQKEFNKLKELESKLM